MSNRAPLMYANTLFTEFEDDNSVFKPNISIANMKEVRAKLWKAFKKSNVKTMWEQKFLHPSLTAGVRALRACVCVNCQST